MDGFVHDQVRDLDALVVGAGFGGIDMLHKLRNELGLDAAAIDKAGGAGGTWFWNKYPGALSDSEGFVYQYSFDRDLYAQTPWTTKFVTQPEILAYLNGVVDRYGLREHIALQTGMTRAEFDEDAGILRTDRGVTFRARFLVTGLGLLSATNLPVLPGMESFEGRLVHTGAWPEDLELTGQRVGVIGNGSTGNQVITATAPIAAHLTSFQRTPQYSVPAGNRALTPQKLQTYRDNFEATWEQVRNSNTAMGFEESTIETFSVSAEERERIFQDTWNEGGGFRFMFETFCDIATNEAANEEAAKLHPRQDRRDQAEGSGDRPQADPHRPLRPPPAVRLRLLPGVQPAQRHPGQRRGNPDHHGDREGRAHRRRHPARAGRPGVRHRFRRGRRRLRTCGHPRSRRADPHGALGATVRRVTSAWPPAGSPTCS